MTLSVIIPTYKPKDYIWDCLGSIAHQTLSSDMFEVFIVLNGCNEPYHTQIQSYIDAHMSHLNVHFIQIDQGGVSNARNIALDRAKGEYITFIDDDDYLSLTCLEEMCNMTIGDNIVCCYPYAFNDGQPEVQLMDYGITRAYEYCIAHGCDTVSSKARKYFSGPCMKLIPMSFIQERRFDIRFKNGEDSLFLFLISDKFKKITFTSRKAIYYRRCRAGSAVSNFESDRGAFYRNCYFMICAYSYIYWQHPFRYNLFFYITRMLGVLHSVVAKSRT